MERRLWLLAACVALLGAGAGLLAATRGDEPGGGKPAGERRAATAGARILVRGLARGAAEARRRGARELARAKDGGIGPRLARERAAALRVVARFAGSLALYEGGELTPEIRAELRATATGGFARELLSDPPRAPAGHGLPPPAEGVELGEFVPAGGRVAIVSGTIERGSLGERFAFELRDTPAGWLVSGVGM